MFAVGALAQFVLEGTPPGWLKCAGYFGSFLLLACTIIDFPVKQPVVLAEKPDSAAKVPEGVEKQP